MASNGSQKKAIKAALASSMLQMVSAHGECAVAFGEGFKRRSDLQAVCQQARLDIKVGKEIQDSGKFCEWAESDDENGVNNLHAYLTKKNGAALKDLVRDALNSGYQGHFPKRQCQQQDESQCESEQDLEVTSLRLANKCDDIFSDAEDANLEILVDYTLKKSAFDNNPRSWKPYVLQNAYPRGLSEEKMNGDFDGKITKAPTEPFEGYHCEHMKEQSSSPLRQLSKKRRLGRRGNITQTYPEVEHDFVPNDLRRELTSEGEDETSVHSHGGKSCELFANSMRAVLDDKPENLKLFADLEPILNYFKKSTTTAGPNGELASEAEQEIRAAFSASTLLVHVHTPREFLSAIHEKLSPPIKGHDYISIGTS